MSKKDFQNGFALGLASGGVVEIEKEEQEKSINITENGETVVTPDDENTTLSKVTVNVDVPSKEEQEKSINITENGTTEVTPDDGMALSKVTVNVAIESGGGEDDFIGIKYSNFTDSPYKKPKTADARSLDKILKNSGNIEKDRVLWRNFANNGTADNQGYFTQLEEVYVPTYATSFRQTFDYCSKLTTIHGDLSNIEQLDIAFRNCVSLDINAIIARMPKLRSMGGNTFYGCTQLTEITLPATITYMTGTAFSGCANLTRIKCLFAEGSVTGQPWGATNAVVEYVTEV